MQAVTTFTGLQSKACCLLRRCIGGLQVYSNRRDGVVVRASASQSVDQEFISQIESYQKTLKMVLTASLLGAQRNRDCVENKPASLLVMFLGKALNGMPPSSCGRPMVGPSSLPIVVAQFN